MAKMNEQFARGLEQIRALAAKNGSVKVEEILQAFPGTELSREQIGAIYAFLEQEGIELADYVPHDVNSLPLGESEGPELEEEEQKVYDLYLEELESVPPLSAQEEEKLTAQLLKGSGAAQKAARERLTEGNLLWVVRLARGYAGKGVALADLIQEGNMALFLGLDSYAGEGPLSDHLEKAIKEGMKAALKEQSGFDRAEENLAVLANRVLDATRELEEESGRAVTAEEIARKLGLSAAKVDEVLRESARAIRNAQK